MPLDGKCPGRWDQLNSVSTGGGNLIYLYDEFLHCNFLVDTGASCSVLPFNSKAPANGPALFAANGGRIDTWGCRLLNLSFSGHEFKFSFVLAAVEKPFLGADFLAYFKLLIDPFYRLYCLQTLKPVAAAAELKHSPFISALSQVHELTRELLAEFPGVLPVPGKHSTSCHGVEHVIETSGRPVCAKVRRLDPDKLRCAREEFSKLEAASLYNPVHPYSAVWYEVSQSTARQVKPTAEAGP
jgi:hypothetical protein